MKVDLNAAAPAQLLAEPVKPVATAAKESTPAVTADRTTLNADHTVQTLVNQALQSPQIRQSTVNALRQSVNNGTYQPDASQTASAITSHESQ